MSRHRDDSVRVRPVRAVAFVLAVSLTVTAAVAAFGMLPHPSTASANAMGPGESDSSALLALSELTAAAEQIADHSAVVDDDDVATPPSQPTEQTPEQTPTQQQLDRTPPAGSGLGRRVVLDLSAQQVWLVRDTGSLLRTYLVSGSVYDNVEPGRYEVYSRSETATSYDYSSTMRWMVRFTEGARAAIGFHSIPRTADGEPVQTVQQLGTPLSHGCIRQRPRDARLMWDFAPIGTPVVVTA